MLRKPSPRVLALSIGLAAALVFLPRPGWAQTEAFSASFSGVVHDASEAAIAGAKVTLTNPDKGITRTFTTDSEGRYSFALLPPGKYALVIEATGFSTYKEENIQLDAGQEASEPITLQLGKVRTKVTVAES
jgi:uncharacterized surface anchored protein